MTRCCSWQAQTSLPTFHEVKHSGLCFWFFQRQLGAPLTAHTHAAPGSFRLPRPALFFLAQALQFLDLLPFLLLGLTLPLFTLALLLLFGLAKNSILSYLISKIFLVYKIRSNAYGTSEDYHARSAYPAH